MIYCSLKGCRKRIDPDLHSRYKNGTERIGKMNLVLDIGILVFLVFFFFRLSIFITFIIVITWIWFSSFFWAFGAGRQKRWCIF